MLIQALLLLFLPLVYAQQAENVTERLEKLEAYIKYVEDDTAIIHDYVWILASTFLVLTMQAGFALLESGLIRAKNAHNVLLKNVLDGCVGAVFWLTFGYILLYDLINTHLIVTELLMERVIGLQARQSSWVVISIQVNTHSSSFSIPSRRQPLQSCRGHSQNG